MRIHLQRYSRSTWQYQRSRRKRNRPAVNNEGHRSTLSPSWTLSTGEGFSLTLVHLGHVAPCSLFLYNIIICTKCTLFVSPRMKTVGLCYSPCNPNRYLLYALQSLTFTVNQRGQQLPWKATRLFLHRKP